MTNWQESGGMGQDEYREFKDFLDKFDVGSKPAEDTFNWLGKKPGMDAGTDLYNNTNNMLSGGSPYLGQSSQAGNYGSLIKLLGARAQGQGPSVAGDAYNTAANNAMYQQLAMANGNNAGAGRQAAMNASQIGQGLATGYGAARNQEMQGATAQLGGAIGGADMSELKRQQANQDAWLKMLQEQYGLDKQRLQGAAQGKTNGEQLGGIVKSLAAL